MFQVLWSLDEFSSDAVVLDVIPHLFVGIDFWSVGRQKEEPELSLQRFNKLCNLLTAMHWVTVQNEKDIPRRSYEKPP